MNKNNKKIKILEVSDVEELQNCVDLQKKVFATPDLEISPVRHLIVTKAAGGFTLGAFDEEKMVGFVLSVPMFKGEERAFYSHMTAVDDDYQSLGIGRQLKWAQRARALSAGVKYIKWTFQPVQARNAFFNLERLGATISSYAPNFYGTDYNTSPAQNNVRGIDSDRLFADWYLESPKVVALANGDSLAETEAPVQTVEIPADWNGLVIAAPEQAIAEQERIKAELQTAFAAGLVARGFIRSESNPKYLLYQR